MRFVNRWFTSGYIGKSFVITARETIGKGKNEYKRKAFNELTPNSKGSPVNRNLPFPKIKNSKTHNYLSINDL